MHLQEVNEWKVVPIIIMHKVKIEQVFFHYWQFDRKKKWNKNSTITMVCEEIFVNTSFYLSKSNWHIVAVHQIFVGWMRIKEY